jgi:hypothetical protein
MTNEEIIDMAKQAGFDPHDMSADFTCNLDNIEAFAKLIAEREREACAKIADGWPDYDVQGLAEAIRARGQE